MGLYAASKHALEGASEALYHELRPWNIHVTIVQPGFVSSEAYEKTRLGLVMERRQKGFGASLRLAIANDYRPWWKTP